MPKGPFSCKRVVPTCAIPAKGSRPPFLQLGAHLISPTGPAKWEWKGAQLDTVHKMIRPLAPTLRAHLLNSIRAQLQGCSNDLAPNLPKCTKDNLAPSYQVAQVSREGVAPTSWQRVHIIFSRPFPHAHNNPRAHMDSVHHSLRVHQKISRPTGFQRVHSEMSAHQPIPRHAPAKGSPLQEACQEVAVRWLLGQVAAKCGEMGHDPVR